MHRSRVKQETDCFASWLPLYHDFGFVVGVCMPLLCQAKLVLITEKFRSTWSLRMITPHGCVATAGTMMVRYDSFGRIITDVGLPRRAKACKYFSSRTIELRGRKGSGFPKITGVQAMSSDSPNNSPPCVGIFWVVQAKDDAARLITAGCSLEQANPTAIS